MWLLSVWILLEPLYHKHVTVNCHFYQYEYGHSYYAHRFLILNSFTLFSWTDSDLMPGQLPAVCVCSSNRRRTRDQRESESVSVRPEAACHKVRLAVIICWSMCVCVCYCLCGVRRRGESYGLCSLTQTNVKSPFTLYTKKHASRPHTKATCEAHCLNCFIPGLHSPFYVL